MNTILAKKNTLERINTRITSRRTVSDMEDRMMEIMAMEQNKGKRTRRLEDPETSVTTLNVLTLTL